MQMSRRISGLTGPKFTKDLSDAEESSLILTQQLALRYSHPLLNASAHQNFENFTVGSRFSKKKTQNCLENF